MAVKEDIRGFICKGGVMADAGVAVKEV